MFLFDISFSLEILALISGTGLYIWSSRNVGTGTSLGRIIGLIAIVLSALALVCSLHFNAKLSSAYFNNGPIGLHAMALPVSK